MDRKVSGDKRGKAKRKAKSVDPDLERKIRNRVILEEKAFRVVERLTEETVDELTLTELVQLIDQNHYDDITEERFLADICGYPLCAKAVLQVSSQRYHISSSSNRVLDITDRKKFCSNRCYKASKHFGSQILTSPVWLREENFFTKFGFLPLDETNKGSAGEDVIFSPAQEVMQEINLLNEIDERKERSQKRLDKVLSTEQKSSLGQHDLSVKVLSEQLSKVSLDLTSSEKEAKQSQANVDDTKKLESDNGLVYRDQSSDVDELRVNSEQSSQSNARNIDNSVTIDASKEKDTTESEQPSQSTQTHTESIEDHVSNMIRTRQTSLSDQNHMQQGSEMAQCRKVLQQNGVPITDPIPPDALQRVLRKASRGTPGTSGPVDYNFDHQPRHKVYGFDAQQQMNKMETNKELLHKELKSARPVTENNSETVAKTDTSSNETPLSPEAETKAATKGDLLLQLLEKRDELKRVELNDKQNVALETQSSEQVANTKHKSKVDSILENVERASAQKHAFETDQSESRESADSDDDDDDINENKETIQRTTSNIVTKASELPSTKPKTKKISPIVFVQNILFSWKTQDSVDFFKRDLSKKGEASFEEKYAALGRRVDKAARQADLIGELDSDDDAEGPINPLPDIQTLQSMSKDNQYALKVREFYSKPETDCDKASESKVAESAQDARQEASREQGSSQGSADEAPRLSSAVNEDAKTRRFRKKNFPMQEEPRGEFDRKEFVTEQEVVLPFVDSSSQISIRRKIVLDKIGKVIPELLTPLRLTLSDVGPSLRELVYTFNLTSSNITMRPADWTIMAFLLLNLLAARQEEVSRGFELLSARTYFERLKETIEVGDGQLKHIVRKFTH